MHADGERQQGDETPVRAGFTGDRGIRRLMKATGYSLAGLASAWRSEEAFRIEAILALLMLPLAIWLGQSAIERSLLIGSVLLVLVVELLNTAIEYTVDRIGTDRHHLSGGAKDLASAAVLLSLITTTVIWCLVAWDRFSLFV